MKLSSFPLQSFAVDILLILLSGKIASISFTFLLNFRVSSYLSSLSHFVDPECQSGTAPISGGKVGVPCHPEEHSFCACQVEAKTLDLGNLATGLRSKVSLDLRCS